jgi:hypothetical protein
MISAIKILTCATLAQATALFNRDNDGECFVLTDSVECPNQNGKAIGTAKEYRNTAEFDAFMTGRKNTNKDYISKFRSDYSCPEYEGIGQQFQQALYCSMIAVKPSTCTVPDIRTPAPLCKETCMQALNSLQNVFDSICISDKSSGALFTRREAINNYKRFCDSLEVVSPRNGWCLDGSKQPVESELCGFGTTQDAKRFCSKINNANICCKSVDPNAADTVLSAPAESSNFVSVPLLVIILIIVVFFLQVLAFFIINRRKRQVVKVSPRKQNPRSAPAKQAKSPVKIPSAESFGSSKAVLTPAQSTLVRVTAKYDAKMPDELELKVGDVIELIESYPDGWALGKHQGTGKLGAFPLVCTVVQPDVATV